MIEISKAFEYEDFTAFDRKRFPKARPLACTHAARAALCASWKSLPGLLLLALQSAHHTASSVAGCLSIKC